jgi:hypothetical protein
MMKVSKTKYGPSDDLIAIFIGMDFLTDAKSIIRFEVLTAVARKSTIFWD